MFDDELDVFYDDEDFAVQCTRERPGESDARFNGILSVVDTEQFEGHAVNGQQLMRYPASIDVLKDDVIRTVRLNEAGQPQPAQVWRVVRHPERVVDGAECDVYLSPDPDA